MNPAVVRRTQDALGKVIRRPPLTEKLLSKPPFRYLHDIITEVIRMTGFMKGLYTDAEMKSDNVKDKDAKIRFLQKTIDVVAMVSGEPLAARPVRIVAGHEPERTNELLQVIGRCCLSQLSSEDAVKKVLAGEKGGGKGRPARPREPDNQSAAGEEPGVRENEEDRRNSEIKERSPSKGQKQKEEVKEDSKLREKEKERAKDPEGDRRKDHRRDKFRDGEREKSKSKARREMERDQDRGDRERDQGRGDRDRERDHGREQKAEGGGREKERPRERDKARERERDKRRAKNAEHSGEKGREPEQPERKTAGPGEVSRKSSDGPSKDPKTETETEHPPRASRPLLTKTSRRRSRSSAGGTREANTNSASVCDGNPAGLWPEDAEPEPAARPEGDSPSDAEGDAGPAGQEKCEAPENSEIPSEPSSSLRRMPRPGSARPAPPRVKRQESAEVLPVERVGSAKAVASVIPDSQDSGDEEDSQFVVEATLPLAETPEVDLAPAVELEEDEKHGGLVKKILETKKDYEKLQESSKPGEKEKSLLYELAWKKEKEVVSKEIEKLRVSIQTLCKSALPLGKIMDYIQEDVDAMQNELQLWRSESQQHAEALHQERSITDAAVEPLKAELAELEQLMKEQQDRICAVKANILRNEEKIQKMVHSVTLSSRR